MSFRPQWKNLNPYDVHKLLINEYILTKKGTTNLLKRNLSQDKTDRDTVRENMRFLWDEETDPVDTWEKKLAKRYYDKLYKEYCIGDLTLYKENKVGLRWRTETEVISGKGQFSCGAKGCEKDDDLRTWEVNFKYIEFGEKKNALVKIRLCPKCSKKLNYHWKKNEVKRVGRKLTSTNDLPPLTHDDKNLSPGRGTKTVIEPEASCSSGQPINKPINTEKSITNAWKETHNPIESNEEKTQEDEMDEYLQDLFM